jgi:hypothetical protein
MASPFLTSLMRGRSSSASAKPAESESDDDCCEVTDDLQAAAEDVLVALGQDYGASESESGKNAFHDKAKRLAQALRAFCVCCASMD